MVFVVLRSGGGEISLKEPALLLKFENITSSPIDASCSTLATQSTHVADCSRAGNKGNVDSPKPIIFYAPSCYRCQSDDECAGLWPAPNGSMPPRPSCYRVRYQKHWLYFVHAVMLSAPLHDKLGVRFVETKLMERADLIFWDVRFSEGQQLADFLTDEGRRPDQKIIIVEALDLNEVQSVQPGKNIMAWPPVIGVIKHHSWKPPLCFCGSERDFYYLESATRFLNALRRQNEPLLGFCSSCEISAAELQKTVQLVDDACTALPPCLASRVASLIPSWLLVMEGHTFPEPWGEMPFQDRPIDVLVMSGGKFEAWRADAAQRVMQLRQTHPQWEIVVQERLPTSAFRAILRKTKIFLSPFGKGQWSGKDDECVLSGAVLMKPMAGLFDNIVPMYEPNVSCLSVRPDYNNLESILEFALSHPAMLERISHRAYFVAKSFSGYGQAVQHPLVIERFAAFLRTTLGICTTSKAG